MHPTDIPTLPATSDVRHGSGRGGRGDRHSFPGGVARSTDRSESQELQQPGGSAGISSIKLQQTWENVGK